MPQIQEPLFFKEFQFLTSEFKGKIDGMIGTTYPKTAQLEYLRSCPA